MKGSDAPTGLYTSQSAFNAGASYLQNLTGFQELLTAAQLSRDYESLLEALYMVHSDYSPPWTKDEYARVLKLLDDINDLLHPRITTDHDEIHRKNQAVPKFREARREIFQILHKHGQLVPLSMNPAHAVTQGSG